MPPVLFFFLMIALSILGLLWFHINFRNICSSSVKKKCHRYFDGDHVKSVDSFGNYGHFNNPIK